MISAITTRKRTTRLPPSDADDSFDPENPEVDFELLADGTLVETATLSDAEMPERRSILNVLKESIISLFGAETDEGEGSEGRRRQRRQCQG